MLMKLSPRAWVGSVDSCVHHIHKHGWDGGNSQLGNASNTHHHSLSATLLDQ